MVTIDYEAVNKAIRFAIEHPYRYDQVADYITELFIQLVSAHEAVNRALQDHLDARITLDVKISGS